MQNKISPNFYLGCYTVKQTFPWWAHLSLSHLHGSLLLLSDPLHAFAPVKEGALLLAMQRS